MPGYITPSAKFDFTSGTLSSSITFSRSGSTATRTNSSGYVELVSANTARFDYDPVSLVCKGLLIEEARTNIFTYSDDFTNVIWAKTRTSVSANAVVSPDGTQNADKVVEDTSANTHIIAQSSSWTSGVSYTVSVYAKAGERTQLRLRALTQTTWAGQATFDLSTGQVSGITGSAQIFNCGNGWYRCSVTSTALATASTGVGVYLMLNGSITYTGDGTSGLYLWGAQREVGGFLTSYIPTTASSSTRNVDVATITGTNFSSFWQSVKGGATAVATPVTTTAICPLVQFDDGTANEIIALRGNTTNPELYIVDGGTPQAQLDAGTISANTDYSLTGWWQTDDCKARKDSGAVVTDATATIPTVTQARIGSDGTNYLNGTIATINYYDSFFGQPIYTRRKNKVFSSLL